MLRFHREDGSHVQVSAVDAEGLLPLSTSISAQYKPSISCRHTRVIITWLLVDAEVAPADIILYHLQRDSESLLLLVVVLPHVVSCVLHDIVAKIVLTKKRVDAAVNSYLLHVLIAAPDDYYYASFLSPV